MSDRAKTAETQSYKVNLYGMNQDGSGVALLTTQNNHIDFAPNVNEQGEVFLSGAVNPAFETTSKLS